MSARPCCDSYIVYLQQTNLVRIIPFIVRTMMWGFLTKVIRYELNSFILHRWICACSLCIILFLSSLRQYYNNKLFAWEDIMKLAQLSLYIHIYMCIYTTRTTTKQRNDDMIHSFRCPFTDVYHHRCVIYYTKSGNWNFSTICGAL